MIFIQHGPSAGPKIEGILQRNLANGIILDPREDTIEKIKELQNKTNNFNGIIKMVDPKYYYAQFKDSISKKLTTLDYYPNNLVIDRAYLRNINKLTEDIEKIVKFQKDLNVDYYISPTLYLESFNDRLIDKNYDIFDIFDEKTPNATKFATLLLTEYSFESNEHMNEFIDDFSNYIGRYEGIYLIIDRELYSNNIRNSFLPKRLANIMQLIYSLKKMQFKVIVGYSGIESINYMAAGADAIGTGWFYSLRKFNRIEKGFEESTRGGHTAKKRYTSINLLSELKIDEHILSINSNIKNDLYKIIINNTSIDNYIIDKSYDSIPTNLDFFQYFETMNILFNNFKKHKTIDEKITYLNNIINNAIINIKKYNTLNKLLNLTTKHLEDYQEAIQIFMNENFI